MAREQKKPSLDGEDAIFLKAKNDALRLLSFRPRSTSELRKRLKIKKYPDEITNKVVDIFTKTGLLDDRKFAKLFANSRIYTRPTGRRRLEFDLKKSGVSESVASETLAGLGDYDEKNTAKELVRNRFARMTGLSDEKKKARIFGFLQRRGFSSSVIFTVLSELFSAEGGSASGGKEIEIDES